MERIKLYGTYWKWNEEWKAKCEEGYSQKINAISAHGWNRQARRRISWQKRRQESSVCWVGWKDCYSQRAFFSSETIIQRHSLLLSLNGSPRVKPIGATTLLQVVATDMKVPMMMRWSLIIRSTQFLASQHSQQGLLFPMHSSLLPPAVLFLHVPPLLAQSTETTITIEPIHQKPTSIYELQKEMNALSC